MRASCERRSESNNPFELSVARSKMSVRTVSAQIPRVPTFSTGDVSVAAADSDGRLAETAASDVRAERRPADPAYRSPSRPPKGAIDSADHGVSVGGPPRVADDRRPHPRGDLLSNPVDTSHPTDTQPVACQGVLGMTTIPADQLEPGDTLLYQEQIHHIAHVERRDGWAWPIASDTSGWAIALGHGLVDVRRGPQHYGEQAFGFDEGVLPGTPDESYSIDIGAYGSTAYPARHAASAGRTAGVRLSGSTTCDVADRLRLRDNDNAVYYMDPTCGPQQWRERRWSSPDHDDSPPRSG